MMTGSRVQQPTKKVPPACRQHIPSPDEMQQKKERADFSLHPLFQDTEFLARAVDWLIITVKSASPLKGR